jgi:hypothetical protein
MEERTHAKPPPATPGDLGSGDQDAPPPPQRGKGGAQIVAGASGGGVGVSSKFNL